MKKSQIFALAVAALGVLALGLSLEAYRFKKIEKQGPAELSGVTAELPANPEAVSAAVRNTFNVWDDLARTNFAGTYKKKFPTGSKWRSFYLFTQGGTGLNVFPPDEEILLDRGEDSFVRRYVAIAPELRRNDFYLHEVTGDEFWPSEYMYRGQPAKFRCGFFIHLEPRSGSQTRVEVFEYQPMIWAGEKFGMSAHAILPTMLHDIRSAEATTADRVEVVTMIRDGLAAPKRD
jgi:hypothetical protein